MRALMTGITAVEFAQHLGIVRFAVTILAFRYNRMFSSMAEYALEAGVLGRAGLKRRQNAVMAGSAVLVGNFFTVGKGQWLVHLVTLDTVCEFLPFCMWFMAVQAVRLISVGVMTEGAIHFGMRTCKCIYLFDYTWMAGFAGRLEFTLEGDVQRLMGIGMAAKTVFKGEVILPFMTFGTLGNNRAFF